MKENHFLDESPLHVTGEDVLSLFRLSITCSVVMSLSIVLTIYMLLEQTMFLMTGSVLMFVLLILSFSLVTKNKWIRRTLAVLGGLSPSVVALLNLLLFGIQITTPIGVGMGIAMLVGGGAFLAVHSLEKTGAGAFWSLSEKCQRVLVWLELKRQGWDIQYLDTGKEPFYEQVFGGVWVISKTFSGEEKPTTYSYELRWWNDKTARLTETDTCRSKFELQLHLSAITLEDNILVIEERIRCFEERRVYVLALTQKWISLYANVLRLKNVIGDNRKLLEYSRDWDRSRLYDHLLDILPSKLTPSVEFYSNRLKVLFDHLKQTWARLRVFHEHDAKKFGEDTITLKEYIQEVVRRLEQEIPSEIRGNSLVECKLTELNKLIDELNS